MFNSFFKTSSSNGIVLKINGVPVEVSGKSVSIEISGDLDVFEVEVDGNLKTSKSGPFSIKVNGNVGDLEASQGTVSCNNVTRDVKTSQGKVTCGNVGGNVETGMGSIKYRP